MSQRKQKIKRQFERQKLKDQAKIIYLSSKLETIESGKLRLIYNAVMKIIDIKCPERTEYLKEAISLAERLKLWATAYKLASLAYTKGDEKEFFLKICKKHQGRKNESPGTKITA